MSNFQNREFGNLIRFRIFSKSFFLFDILSGTLSKLSSYIEISQILEKKSKFDPNITFDVRLDHVPIGISKKELH